MRSGSQPSRSAPRRRRPKAEYGTFRVLLIGGGEFTFTGIIRRYHDPDGLIDDLDIEGDTIMVAPLLGDIAALLRVVDTEEDGRG